MTTSSSASSFITTRRRVTVLLFTWTAGSVDAITYLRAHVFTANMTGNSVLLALAVGQREGAAVARASIALVAFIIGVVLGAIVAGEGGDRVKTFTAVRREVFFETAALALFAIVCVRPPTASIHAAGVLVIFTSGIAMGMQSAAVKRLSLPGIATTYITGTITSLFSGVVHTWITRKSRVARQAAETAPGHPPQPSMRHSVGLQAQVYLSYTLAALACGVLHNYWPSFVAILPVLAIASIGIYMLFAKPATRLTSISSRQDISA
ncbi:MAG TPA: YoaK family protein [Candidatus Angelobacter sp.]|nr:YoaK family protein [Candidatus Angelobacter sp.]